MLTTEAGPLGCSANDYACLCTKPDFQYGLRDCSNEACGAAVGSSVVAYGSSICASKFLSFVFMIAGRELGERGFDGLQGVAPGERRTAVGHGQPAERHQLLFLRGGKPLNPQPRCARSREVEGREDGPWRANVVSTFSLSAMESRTIELPRNNLLTSE
jgi:hypothetical protein